MIIIGCDFQTRRQPFFAPSCYPYRSTHPSYHSTLIFDHSMENT